MPFTDEDRNLLAAVAERTKCLPCAEHEQRISHGEAYGKAALWLLGMIVAGYGLLQAVHCLPK